MYIYTHIVYIYIPFILLYIGGHWGCLFILTTVNIAAMNIGCTYPFEFMFSYSSYKYSEVEYLDHVVILVLIFPGISITVFCSGYTNLHSH